MSPPSTGLVHLQDSTAMTKGLQAIVFTFFESSEFSFVSFLLELRQLVVQGILPKGPSVYMSRI